MADIGTLLMKVEAQTTDFDKKMNQSSKGVGAFGKATMVAAGVVAVGIAKIVADGAKAFEAQEQAEARLSSIATTVTKATDEQVESMKNLAAQYQKVTTFGDDVLIAGQSQLLSFGLQTDQTEDLTESLANMLAATKGVNATQEDAINAANMLGKAYSGQTGALTRAGILLDDTQASILQNGTEAEKTAALIEIMEQNYGGLAEGLADTSEGMRVQVNNALGDIQEKIGAKVLPMFNKFLVWVTDHLPEIEKFVDDSMEAVGKAFDFVSNFVTTYLVPAFEKFREITGAVETAGSGMAERMQPIIERAFTVILEISSRMYDFYKNYLMNVFEMLAKFWEENGEQISDIVVTAFDAIIKIVEIAWDLFDKYLLPVIEKLLEIAIEYFPKIAKVIIDNIQIAIDIINGIISVIETMIEWIEKAVGWLADLFSYDGKSVDVDVNENRNVTVTEIAGTTVESSSGYNPYGVDGYKANGGPVAKGSTYMTGENGRELFVPDTNGVILPNELTEQLMSGNGNGQGVEIGQVVIQVEQMPDKEELGKIVNEWLGVKI